ncbi:unnamed protein product, partial [Closterium sp. NIES-53]
RKYDSDWISALPDVYGTELTEDAEFVIIASDGLWDAFSRYKALLLLLIPSPRSPHIATRPSPHTPISTLPAPSPASPPPSSPLPSHSPTTPLSFVRSEMEKHGDFWNKRPFPTHTASLPPALPPTTPCYPGSSEAVAFVRGEMDRHGDVQQACEALVHAALHDRETEDNTSVVVISLRG